MRDSALKYFENLAKPNTVDNHFWLRMRPDGIWIKEVPDKANHETYVIHLGRKGECFWLTDIMNRLP